MSVIGTPYEAHIEIAANLSSGCVEVSSSTGFVINWSPDVAIDMARKIMHAAYALGYEEKEEK